MATKRQRIKNSSNITSKREDKKKEENEQYKEEEEEEKDEEEEEERRVSKTRRRINRKRRRIEKGNEQSISNSQSGSSSNQIDPLLLIGCSAVDKITYIVSNLNETERINFFSDVRARFEMQQQILENKLNRINIENLNNSIFKYQDKRNRPKPYPDEPSVSEGSDLCKICQDKSIKTVVLPCGHCYMCVSCSIKLNESKCCVCRGEIFSIFRTFT